MTITIPARTFRIGISEPGASDILTIGAIRVTLKSDNDVAAADAAEFADTLEYTVVSDVVVPEPSSSYSDGGYYGCVVHTD